ncbi:hypothetical protein CVT24_002459 [Panaeolus cyanescens]|uniref:Lysine-specific metallo-endopeptidase domain-containing protein n=1 Tax=Panaeolus cyanescens TaxID=181874 RepID=A0A409X5W3_9AGAR|nr:hypothetical protein CVT24_002459 [Panaeolus cyanescens]
MKDLAQKALTTTNTAERSKIKHVFGNSPEYNTISVMANMLATIDPVLGADNVALTDQPGTYGTAINGVLFLLSTLFHAQATGVRQRARTVIHESSHILPDPFKTFDYWGLDANGDVHGITKDDLPKYTTWIYGYWHAGYSELRTEFSNFMHLNADTWAVFGYYCLYNQDPPAGTTAGANWTP